jgi:protein O-mannosyl-transferase
MIVPSSVATDRSRWINVLGAVVVAIVIALVYWPVRHAQFVWDDILDFQRVAWLRHGNDWQHLLLNKFNDWVAYFRPLGVALFTAEVRAFGATPGPMHLISLLIHLINTLLVGVLAMQLGAKRLPQNRYLYAFGLPMLLYGLHPVLVEPVVWIGCQFDLIATLFMLLGWLGGLRIQHPALRALGVGSCFFLAACAKESAIAFLPILIVLNWFALEVSQGEPVVAQLRKLLTHDAATYSVVMLAGIAYLVFRHLALGHLIPNTGGHILPLGGRLQESSFLYLHYWRMFFWPTVHMGPIHLVDTDQFLKINARSLLRDVLALGIVVTGIVLTLRRKYLGALILCVTLALFPVLHIIATNFDTSLYHERYALTALAIACAWFPLVLSELPTSARMRRTLSLMAYISLAAWLVLAVMSIRVTLPLWSTQVNLWQWALQENPSSIIAKDELIAGYLDAGDNADAWRLIDGLIVSNTPCTVCFLNAATLSLHENNPKRADFFLQRIKNTPELYNSPTSIRIYLTDVGAIQLMEGKYDVAERVERLAAAREKLDPTPQLFLAEALAFEGKTDEATQAENAAIPLMEPDQREHQQQWFAQFIEQLHDHPEESYEALTAH